MDDLFDDFCVIYQADLDCNKIQDFIVFYNYRGCGLASQYDRADIILAKKDGSYQKLSYDTICSGLEDFIDLDKDGKYEVIITDTTSDGKHTYFAYSIYKFKDERMINANSKFKGFPKFIRYTYNKNDKDTRYLTKNERSEAVAKKDRSINLVPILGP